MSTPAANLQEPPRTRVMKLTEENYLWKVLSLDCPQTAESLTAAVRVIQPQGYVSELASADVMVRDGVAHVRLLYPLIDDGRYDAAHGAMHGAWEMGAYRFEVQLSAGGRAVAEDTLTLDPHTFFPRDRTWIAVDAWPQIIECAPRQALYTSEDSAGFLIGVRRRRVHRCEVEVDVVEREGSHRLAGPWRLHLGHDLTVHRFDIAGWSDGEYWIRIRVLIGGELVGPYCVRKFWIQRPLPEVRPDVIELRGHAEVLVDGAAFEHVEGVMFVPDVLERSADGPPVSPTEPHEAPTLSLRSVTWNDARRRYEWVYGNGDCAAEDKPREQRIRNFRMLATSIDGVRWEKPRLGRIEYEGSTQNNILMDQPIDDDPQLRKKDRDIEHARFRFYDADRDGPVDIDRVFLSAGKGYFPFDCKSLRGGGNIDAGDREGGALGVSEGSTGTPADAGEFRPQRGEFWPMEKRGDLYLVLSHQPLLYLGVGMDLYHTTENVRCHVEQSDRMRLLIYFRPGSPAYPPHGAPCDNMHLCLRNLGVLWTDDGLTWHRRFVLAPDEFDPIGQQFYSIGFFNPYGAYGDAPGRSVLQKLITKVNLAFHDRHLFLGVIIQHRGLEQRQSPELCWTRDFLTFHRFAEYRRPMIENGPGGSYDFGMVRSKADYFSFGDQWWVRYLAVNTRHNGYGIMARWTDIEQYKARYPNHADSPDFTTWEGHWADGKATRYLSAIARCKVNRVAHAEPVDADGMLMTRLLRVDGDALHVNAATEPGGELSVQVEDEHGKPLLSKPFLFSGDEVRAKVADLIPHAGKLIRLRFQLHRARLYAFEITNGN